MKRLYKSKNSQKSTLVFYKLHKKLKVFITIVCLISILFNYVPWNLVSATTVSESQIIPESNSELQNEIVEQDIFENDYLDNSLVPVDFEVVDKRTEYEKHFRKIDGTYEVGIYNQAVHYLNNGLWKDIDNSLNEYETTLETKANKFKLEFPKKLDDNKQIKLKMDNYNINWKVLGIDKTDAYYQNGQIKSTNLKELTNVSQSVKYNNIQNNVDIEYIVAGSDIKENIILNEYVPNFSISFEYKLKDLEIVQNDEGNVLFVNEDNETIFTFEELFMFDKNENVSFDLDYEIQDTGNNTYVITITPDDDWLSKANYPVVIDPTLKSGTTSMSIYDTYVSESNPDTNYSSSSIMTISNISSTDEFRGLINFSIPSSIINKVITYSHLNLTGRQAYSGGQINVYKNTQSFNPSTVTWNLRPNHDSRVVDYYTIVGTNNKYIFDITKPVKEWQATGNPMTTGFTIAEDEWQGKYISVNQMESYTEGDRPLITIGYEEPAGLKDYWTYTSQDMGMLGTGYISDYTGNLTFVRNDFTLKNEYTSLSLDFFYNNYSRSTDIGYGAGWRNNFNIEVKLDTTSNKYYMFKPDGNKVYFMNESCSPEYYGSTNFNCTSISEDGSRIILKRSYNSYGNTTIQITTKSDFDFNFDSGGRLISIRDIKTNRYIRIYYIDSSLKIDYVKDDADNRIDFTYNADNSIKIELMLKQSNGTLRSVEEKNYFFDSYNNIDLITQGFRYGTSSNSMVYDNTLQYEFDSDHKFLNGYNENNNYKIEYQYNTNKKVNKVITSYRDSLKQIGQFDIVYNFNKTTYTNYTGISIYYTFDNYGHTINITDDYGNTTFYKYSGLFTNINNRRENGYDLLNLEPNYYNNHKLLESSDVIKQQQNPITNHGFESKNEDWVEVGWTKYPGSDGIIEFTSSEAMLGDRSLKIQKVSSSVYASQEIYLKDGTYTVVAWIKNDGTTPGAYVDILNADIKQAITKVDNSDRWVKYQLSFTLTSSKNVTVKLVNDSVSSAYFDNIQILEGSIDTDTLQESTVDSRYNSLLNNSFETGSTGWSLFSFSVVNINETGIMEDILGKKAVCIVGDGSSEYRFEQEITSLVTQGETYMVGGWAKANAVPNKGAFNGSIPTSDGRFFGYNVYIYNEPLDGTTPYWSITYLPFDSSVDTWQYQMKTFEVPTIAKSVIITGVYKGEGTAYFDNIQLYHDKIGTDYSYDTKGNLVSVENKNGEVTSYKYDTNDKVIEVTSNDITTYIDRNSTFQIEEVARNNVRSTLEYNQTTKQVTSAYVGYDKNVTIQEQDKWFKTSTTYTADYQYVKTLKDEFGNITTTNIDPTVALITSITDALGNSQSFEYDEHGRLVTTNSNDVNGNSMQVSYEYLNGRLWKITREDLVYEFIYNNLEQLEQVKIANVTVMSYDYVEENKNDVMYYTDILNSQTYENGDIVSFEYTDEDEIKTIKFNNEIRFS
ncbi:MAG: wapA1, partial [Haloplasmataceae bacterium]|nr:wapA1 [Haloplasmataceae bacterium]